jgi:hypothetical protein
MILRININKEEELINSFLQATTRQQKEDLEKE